MLEIDRAGRDKKRKTKEEVYGCSEGEYAGDWCDRG